MADNKRRVPMAATTDPENTQQTMNGAQEVNLPDPISDANSCSSLSPTERVAQMLALVAIDENGISMVNVRELIAESMPKEQSAAELFVRSMVRLRDATASAAGSAQEHLWGRTNNAG